MTSTRDLGGAAEAVAERELLRHGYTILERNFQIQQGEIDLVADDQGVICFVEVRSRARTDLGLPEETIGREKRRRIARAAEAWLVRHEALDRVSRFDVVAIDDEAGVRLYRDAFRLDDLG